MILASVAGAIGALGSSSLGLGISRACVGFGTAAVVPVANSILGQIFDGPVKASRISIFNLGLFLGGVAGFATGIAVGFPAVVVAIAIPGLVLSILITMLPVPQTHEVRSAAASGEILGSPFAYVAAMISRFFRDARRLLAIP